MPCPQVCCPLMLLVGFGEQSFSRHISPRAVRNRATRLLLISHISNAHGSYPLFLPSGQSLGKVELLTAPLTCTDCFSAYSRGYVVLSNHPALGARGGNSPANAAQGCSAHSETTVGCRRGVTWCPQPKWCHCCAGMASHFLCWQSILWEGSSDVEMLLFCLTLPVYQALACRRHLIGFCGEG